MNLVLYVTDLLLKGWASYLTLFIMFGALVGALFMYRGEHLGGYARYKQFIGVSLLSVVIASAISAIFWFIMITVIDTTILDQMKEVSVERTLKAMEKMERIFGEIPEEQYEEAIDQAIDKAENGKSLNVPWVNALLGFFGNLFMLLPLAFLAPVFARKIRSEEDTHLNQNE